MSDDRNRAWDGRSKGGPWLFLTCAWLLRWVGVPGARVGSVLIAGGFLLCGGERQYGSWPYWRRLRPRLGRWRHLILAYRRYIAFGRVLCDRQLARLHPERFDLDARGGNALHLAVDSSAGCILLAAHLGNWELSGHLVRTLTRRRVHLVMVADDHAAIQAFLDTSFSANGIGIIDPRDGPDASLRILAALRRGETVCMLGDRVHAGQAHLLVDFLGADVALPSGPFQVAAVSGVPIIPCFLIKTGDLSYRFDVFAPLHVVLPQRRQDRPQALRRMVRLWARILELEVRRNPLQWFNFYDAWDGGGLRAIPSLPGRPRGIRHDRGMTSDDLRLRGSAQISASSYSDSPPQPHT